MLCYVNQHRNGHTDQPILHHVIIHILLCLNSVLQRLIPWKRLLDWTLCCIGIAVYCYLTSGEVLIADIHIISERIFCVTEFEDVFRGP